MTYSISRHIGDIIFSLALAKYTKTDNFILFKDFSGFMTKEVFSIFEPLLEKQTYIKNFSYCPFDFQTPFNNFRYWIKWFTIPESFFYAYGHAREHALQFIRGNKWLDNIEPIFTKKILVNKTNRYFFEDFSHNLSLFPVNDIGFIGHEHEYDWFKKNTFLNIDFIKTNNLLELSQVIQGSELVIGEVSSPHAICQALNKPCISFCRPRNCKSVNTGKLSYLLSPSSKIDKMLLFMFLSENNISFDHDVLNSDFTF